MKVLIFPALLGLAVYSARLAPPQPTHWTGTISNGMKGDKISFDVAPDGKTVSNLTFRGYWRCSGQMEQLAAGPKQTFTLQNGKSSGVVVDPATGGTSARRYEFDGSIGKAAAQGTFRLHINGLSCDTYKLQWTAEPAR
mgnify:CR=1 FL=1